MLFGSFYGKISIPYSTVVLNANKYTMKDSKHGRALIWNFSYVSPISHERKWQMS